MTDRPSAPPVVTVAAPLTPTQNAAAEGLRLADRLALRPRELAACLGVSERALRSLAPELPRIVRHGIVLYPVRAVSAWLDREAKVDGDRVKGLVREVLSGLGKDV